MGSTGEQIAAWPVVGTALHRVASYKVQRLLGFWVMWHAFGSSQALVREGGMPRATEYENRTEFRKVFGCDVSELWPEAAAALAARAGGGE